MKKLILIIAGAILIITQSILFIQNRKMKSTIRNMDALTFNIHGATNGFRDFIKAEEIKQTLNLIDSIHFMILQDSGGVIEDGSAYNFLNSFYPDNVMKKYNYRNRLVKKLNTIKNSVSSDKDKKDIDSLIKYFWSEDSFNNSVALISQRLMYTKIEIIRLDLSM